MGGLNGEEDVRERKCEEGQLTIKDIRGAIGKPATVGASLNICERNLNGIFK